jgi:hypothetical protein
VADGEMDGRGDWKINLEGIAEKQFPGSEDSIFVE